MNLIYAGLALFFAIHVLPTLGGVRAACVAALGERPWKAIHSLVSVGAAVLIVLGWKRAPYEALYDPPAWGRLVPFVVMLPVLYLLIGRRIGTNLKRFTAHPMLWGIVLWGGSHLLANGDLRSVVVFGGFVAYSLFAMWWLGARGKALVATETWPWSSEFRAAAATLAVYAVLLAAHGWISGVALF
jgi:uncharacterized membrane protein